LEIDEEDEKILTRFMPKEIGPQLTLADIIIQRIKEKDAEVAAGKCFSDRFLFLKHSFTFFFGISFINLSLFLTFRFSTPSEVGQ
jgi:hypothetical protein